MKNQVFNAKRIALVILTIVSISIAQVSFASEKNEKTAELKFTGTKEDRPVFLLTLNNKEEDEYFITIKDENNYTLYTEKLKGKGLSKSFRLDIQPDYNNLQFVITSKKTNESTVYKISNRTRVVQDVNVAQL